MRTAPMPMVTIFRTVDITNLGHLKEKGHSAEHAAVLLYRRGGIACEEFYLLPAETKMLEYERIGVNVIIANQNGGINSCDIPFTSDLDSLTPLIKRLTAQVRISGGS